ncbi:YqeG family HAD IIIA-type phosphatase [Oceanithermus sp.]|uniref:YqeG family HAD IIIA-type phosphatase n=1 Tax=Oceanithermus sp. TaxID=2268145 RepID=UPI0025F03A79|nr:YqeG family HAD IIIA-type phosphatase [Oceanithermus sp.]
MRLLWPKARVRRVTELTPEWLAARGLSGLVVDLDNTLVPYGVAPPAEGDLAEWNRALADAGIPVYIVSNAKRGRTRAWAEALGREGWGLAGKPLPWSLRRAVRRMGLAPHEVAVAGDQLFTDVLGANLIGAYSVLVEPIEPKKGLPHTRWVRALERRVLEAMPGPQNGGAHSPGSER